MPGSLLIVHVHVRVVPGSEQAFLSATLRERRGEPARAGHPALRRPAGPRRSPALRARRDLPRPGRGRGAQADRALRALARRRRRADGRAAPRRPPRQRLARRRGLLSPGRALRVRHRDPHRVRAGRPRRARAARPLARPPRPRRHRPRAGARGRGARAARGGGRRERDVRRRGRADDRGRPARLRPGRGRPSPTSSWPAAAAAPSTPARRSRRCSPTAATRSTTSRSSAAAGRSSEPSLPFVAVPDHGRHRLRGDAQRRARLAGAPRQGEPAQPAHAAARWRSSIPSCSPDLPPHVVAASGLDALTQLIEPFVSVRANPLTDGLCREGIARSARSLRRAFEGDLAQAVRVDLALASLFGGLALANAGLGAVHGFAGPIGGMFDAPHGAACAALLPAVVRANARALRVARPGTRRCARYREIAAHRDRPGGRRDRRPRRLGRGARGRAGRARPRALGRGRGRHPRARGEGPRREQHEGQPDRARRSGARGDRATSLAAGD